MAIKRHLGIATPWAGHLPFLVQVVAVMAIIEFGQYWMHRLMHNSTPFWLTRASPHHPAQRDEGFGGQPDRAFPDQPERGGLFRLFRPPPSSAPIR
jgi:sterol desaturase/sphingolipid hydroxylase (fatty acid hydroxylase superfamily)